MRPDRVILSAYLDGEVPPRFAAAIEEAIQSDPSVRGEYEELRALRDTLLDAPTPDITQSAERVWISLGRKVVDFRPVAIWRRDVRLPIPAVAAAAVLLLALAGVLVWTLLPDSSTPAQDYLARSSGVDVTIRVDGTEMEDVLGWLASQNMLGEINIELPEQRFELMGEPVFVKPDQYGGRIIE